MKYEQLNFFETLFPTVNKPHFLSLEEEEKLLDTKIGNLNFDEKVIARTHPWRILHSEDFEQIRETAKTRKEIFKNNDAEIWSYDIPSEKWNSETKQYDDYIGKQLCFKIQNQVIALTFVVENIDTNDICFPAMCMAYMDAEGNRLPFTIRDVFIEQGLGLLNHGKYRLSDTLPKRIRGESDADFESRNFNFASMKTTLGNIIKHLEHNIKNSH